MPMCLAFTSTVCMSFDVNKNLCILWCSTVHGNLLKQEEKVSAA